MNSYCLGTQQKKKTNQMRQVAKTKNAIKKKKATKKLGKIQHTNVILKPAELPSLF